MGAHWLGRDMRGSLGGSVAGNVLMVSWMHVSVKICPVTY